MSYPTYSSYLSTSFPMISAHPNPLPPLSSVLSQPSTTPLPDSTVQIPEDDIQMPSLTFTGSSSLSTPRPTNADALPSIYSTFLSRSLYSTNMSSVYTDMYSASASSPPSSSPK